jgi:quinoprotein glucose dehydrogenase
MQARSCNEIYAILTRTPFPQRQRPCSATPKARMTSLRTYLLMIMIAPLLAAPVWGADQSKSVEWPYYGNDPGGQRFSPLDQVNRGDVSQLKVAWVYHTGDISNGNPGPSKSGFENTPIVIDGTMYISTPFCRVIALNPETGTEKWSYDPQIRKDQPYSEGLINRGVSSWLDPERKPGEACRRRIFIATIDARLIALDAASGNPVPTSAAREPSISRAA